MTTHIYHPDSHEFGLQDGCPRCAEHAVYPWQSLDSVNLANLKSRIKQHLPPRSDLESRAMGTLLKRQEFFNREGRGEV